MKRYWKLALEFWVHPAKPYINTYVCTVQNKVLHSECHSCVRARQESIWWIWFSLCANQCPLKRRLSHTIKTRISLNMEACYIWYLTQVTYIFMQNCRVDFPQNTVRYNGDFPSWLWSARRLPVDFCAVICMYVLRTYVFPAYTFVKRSTIREGTFGVGEKVKFTWGKSKKAFGSVKRCSLSKTILRLKCPRLQTVFDKLCLLMLQNPKGLLNIKWNPYLECVCTCIHRSQSPRNPHG